MSVRLPADDFRWVMMSRISSLALSGQPCGRARTTKANNDMHISCLARVELVNKRTRACLPAITTALA